MDDPNQIEVPASFLALYSNAAGTRLLEPMRFVRERYELCEDLALSLVEQAAMTLHKTGAGERDVLEAMRTGLSSGESVVTATEAVWTVRRIAELAGWEDPGASILVTSSGK